MNEAFIVLAVDDNADSRFAVGSALASLQGVKVIEAASGEEALRQCLELAPHLILLDVQMPGIDGFEVADHLRMAECTRNIPIIFLTGAYKSEEFMRRGYNVGAVDYLLKPVELSLLLNRVRFYQFLTDQERQLSDAIEQLRQHDVDLSAAKDRAEAANRAKDSFLAAMSHELRTPLNSILGFTRRLIEQARPDQIESLNNVMLSGRHLLTIINDILDLAKIEAGKFRLDKGDFRLSDVVQNVRSMISLAAQEKGLTLHVEIAPGTPEILHSDEARLRQALLNLAFNAVKFTNQGSVTVRAKQIALTGPLATLRFDVQDTGIGIEPEIQSELFKPFSQVNATAGAVSGGTGLGLAITRQIARLMGGEAGVTSTRNVGSLFWFTVQVEVGENTPAVTEAVRHNALQRLHDLVPSRRVLLVEDNEMIAELTAHMLGQAGLVIDLAEDGQVALDKVQHTYYDLILMDVHMPRMGGFEATRAIRALPGRRRPPIVAMTASAFPNERGQCTEAGMDDFISKPVEPDEMYSTLLRWLAQS